ncbi:MAG: hypothetical protein H7X88_00940 [Gloeobacteraceae cyanobacterium ES-bin-316]|nr:hypothetical protein [Ferruginibacter sp.]
MKKFKMIDTWGSIGLLVCFTVLSLIKLDHTFLIGYCVLGAWQMMSMVVHAINGWFTHGKTSRYYYQITVAGLAVITLLGLGVPPVLWLLMVVLLFSAPIMAIYYTWLCYQEVYIKMQRPLAALK